MTIDYFRFDLARLRAAFNLKKCRQKRIVRTAMLGTYSWDVDSQEFINIFLIVHMFKKILTRRIFIGISQKQLTESYI